MKKTLLVYIVTLCSIFSTLSEAALINVSSIEIIATKNTFEELFIAEIVALELGTGIDLASSAHGAIAISTIDNPEFAIDDKRSKKKRFYFPETVIDTPLATLVIRLETISDIESIQVFGKLRKKSDFLSMAFYDINGDTIHEIQNLKKTLGKQNLSYYLPDHSGAPHAAVPIPNSLFLFASGFFALALKARRRFDNQQ